MIVEVPTANKEVRMIRTPILTELMALLLVTTGTAIPSNFTSAQEQTPSASAPTDASVYRRGGRMDVRHPLHIGSDYYPKQSLKNHEQGKCTLSFFIEADGTVPAAQ